MLKNREGIVFWEDETKKVAKAVERLNIFDKYAWLLCLLAFGLIIASSSLCAHMFGPAACSVHY